MTCFPFASRRRGAIARLLLAAIAAAGLAAVRLPAQAPGDSVQRLPEDSAVRTGRLPNGLTYYIARHTEPVHRAELRLVVNAGSVLEDERQRGLAHLLEHMAFDGSTHFPKHAVWDYLARVGLATGADVNAETSFDHTMYRLTIPTDTAAIVTNGLQILADWAHGLTLDSTELERERKVVIEEWRLHRGAGARIQDKHFQVLLRGSRYAERQPIGQVSVLEHASIADVRRFYRDWYRPDLMAVVIVGDLDPVEMEARVRALFGAIPAPRHPRPRPRMTVPVSATPLASVAVDSEATATSVSWLSLAPHRDLITVGDYRRSLINTLAEAMLNARLAEAAREADAPFLGASVSLANIVRPLDAWELSARVVDGGAERALARLRAELARVARDGFLATELAREKTALLRRYDQIEAEREKIPSAQLAAQLVGEYLSGSPTPSTEYEVALARRLVPTITADEVNRVLAGFDSLRGRVVLASGPVSSASALPDTATLLAALAGPVAALPAYVDSTANAPLIAHEPEPGKVIATARIDTLGVDIWTLSNGVRVILKPTTLDPGQVLITSYRDGGTSVAPDSELVPAVTALDIVSRSGLGAYDAAALRKRLAGTVASVGGALGPYGEGVWGSGSPKDIATLFQLVYLQFTAPRLDSVAFEQYRAALRDALAHRAARPEAAMRAPLGLLLA
ncbi:MAG: insulinase family protein, partial [Gemmatimonadaceae bacterium]|nr:insulinase family protein [Gemmatimonadaceae bacterium]